jgi:chromosome segregation ATPase
MPPKTQRSGQDDPSTQGTESVEPLDPSERLKQLQAELNQHNTRIDHLSKQRDVLETDINGLSTTVEQVKTTVTNYGAGLKDLHNRLQALEYFYHQKNKMVLAAIGERKPLIDDLIRGYDDELARMEEHLRELAEKQTAAQEQSTQAANVQDDRQKDYDAATNFQQEVTSKLTEMEALRAEITKADDTTDAASMYFLTLEFHSQMRETKILSQHEVSTELRQKLGELEAAKERARAKTAALSTAQAEYTAYKAELDTRRADRRANLLAQIKELYPVPAEPSATDGTGSSSSPTQTPPPVADSTGTPSAVPAATPKK